MPDVEAQRVKRHNNLAVEAAKKFDYSFDSSGTEDSFEYKPKKQPSLPRGTIQEDSDEDRLSTERRETPSKKTSQASNDFYKLSDLESSIKKKISDDGDEDEEVKQINSDLKQVSNYDHNSAIKIEVAGESQITEFREEDEESSYFESSLNQS